MASSLLVFTLTGIEQFLQAIKRLLTFAQRVYPTDPSRCIDFDGFRNPSRGAAGGGSDKLVRLATSAVHNYSALDCLQKRTSDMQLSLPQACSITKTITRSAINLCRRLQLAG